MLEIAGGVGALWYLTGFISTFRLFMREDMHEDDNWGDFAWAVFMFLIGCLFIAPFRPFGMICEATGKKCTPYNLSQVIGGKTREQKKLDKENKIKELEKECLT